MSQFLGQEFVLSVYVCVCVCVREGERGGLEGRGVVSWLILWCAHAGYFEVMFTQQVAKYDQDLGVTTTGPMQMNWLLRSEAYAWYFLPPVTSVLILWW